MPTMTDELMEKHVSMDAQLTKVRKFSEKTKYPLELPQLNFIYGSRQIGKTITRVMEALSYINDQPNYINWQGPRDMVTAVDKEGLPTEWYTTERGRQDWDQLADEFKKKHMQDLSYMYFIYTHGHQHKTYLFNLFREVIGSLEENKGRYAKAHNFNGKPVRYQESKAEIFFEVNYHIIKFRKMYIATRNIMTNPNWFMEQLDIHQQDLGHIPYDKVISDVDIMF